MSGIDLFISQKSRSIFNSLFVLFNHLALLHTRHTNTTRHPSTSWSDGWEKADLGLRESGVMSSVSTELDLHLVLKSGNYNYAVLHSCHIKTHFICKWFQKVIMRSHNGKVNGWETIKLWPQDCYSLLCNWNRKKYMCIAICT